MLQTRCFKIAVIRHALWDAEVVCSKLCAGPSWRARAMIGRGLVRVTGNDDYGGFVKKILVSV